ncbi:MAG: hypothetical protein LIP03_07965 [Bacteroidales bacterium]|nr:hypothetical protein [Bacteroidales bacterium]
MDEILEKHVAIAMDITAKIKPLPLFAEYQHHGYYPFYKDSSIDFLLHLLRVVQNVIEIDLPAVCDISYVTVEKTKQLLMYIAQNPPFEPKLSTLFKAIEMSRDNGLKLINLLEKADLLMLFSTKKLNYKQLVIPEKILLQNANIMRALSEKNSSGSAREAFFLNQLRQAHQMRMPPSGDFFVDEKYTFEVGGPNKTFDQIANLPDSFLAIDDIEIGYGHRIPLWMFGLLY